MEQTNKKLLMGIACLIFIFIGAIVLLVFLRKTNTSAPVPVSSTSPVSPSEQLAQPTLVIPTGTATVILTTNGFEPQTLTVKTKTQVIWKNETGADASINSSDHPTHMQYPPLNLGTFRSGESNSLVFDKPGIYGYHNHFNPEKTGIVIVK